MMAFAVILLIWANKENRAVGLYLLFRAIDPMQFGIEHNF
jgi:hypothetical protein